MGEPVDDSQLQTLLTGLQALSERLALRGAFVDAALVAGSVQALRALRTRLEPPPAAAEQPKLQVVPEPAEEREPRAG